MTDFFTKLKSLSNRTSKTDSRTTNREQSSQADDSPGERLFLPRMMKRFKRTIGKSEILGQLLPPNEQPPGMGLYRKRWAWVVVGVSFGLLGTGLAVYETLMAVRRDLPNTAEVLTYTRVGTLTLKAADGTVLQQIGPATRDKVTLKEIPVDLKEAFLASEDRDFYTHHGLDYQAIIRASLANLTAGQVVEGASTITQQLARIVFLDQERSLGRKLREAMLAQKMEDELKKDQILERYLNLVYLGSGAYGVADAAWVYFSKPVNKLTLSEIAMIAGMAPAPSVYSPLVNPDLARKRRDTVLQRMVDAGFITASERDAALTDPIKAKPSSPKYLNSAAPYFTSYVQQQLPKLVPQEELEAGGLTVETTLNPKWQKYAQETVNYAIDNYGPGEAFEQSALVSIDPRNGEIKVLVGGNDFSKSQFNRATQAQRQPGSTFKTFVYATAIAAGFSPYTTYIDAKYVIDGYQPHNYGKTYRGPVTVRDALISSINIVAVKTLVDVGFDPVIEMAKRMGIKSNLLPAYSLALGSSEVNLLELTSGYGALANKGNHIEPHAVTRVFNRFGKLIYQAKYKPERAIDADSAAITTWMLRGVVNSGTGGNAALPDRAVAGKTGTSEKRRDLWFVGYIPQLVTGVWMGNDDSSPTWGASSTAALTWYDFMRNLTDEIPPESFPDLPELEGRKTTVKAKPVNPKRVYASTTGGREDDGESSDNWEDDAGRSSDDSYRNDSYSNDSYSEPSYDSGYSSNSDDSSYSEPAPEPEPAPAEEAAPAEPPPPAAESAPEPEAAPASDPTPAPISEPPPVVVPTEPAPPPAPASNP